MRDYDFDDKTLEFIYWILIYINFEPEAHGIFLTKEGGGGGWWWCFAAVYRSLCLLQSFAEKKIYILVPRNPYKLKRRRWWVYVSRKMYWGMPVQFSWVFFVPFYNIIRLWESVKRQIVFALFFIEFFLLSKYSQNDFFKRAYTVHDKCVNKHFFVLYRQNRFSFTSQCWHSKKVDIETRLVLKHL